MSHSNSKPNNKTPLLVHFIGHEKERLRKLAAIEQRSLINLAGKFIREGMESLERQHTQVQQPN